MDRIDLDQNATTPLAPEVAAAMADIDAQKLGNPSSQHAAGRRARRLVDDAREAIGRLLGARVDEFRPDRVIFTSGGTEANNLAMFGLAGPPGTRIVVSAVEHPCVLQSASELATRGCQVERLAVDPDGVVQPGELDRWLDGRTSLASVMLANHETGVVQPVAEVAERCQGAGVAVHTDAVQAVGKMPVDFHALGVTSLAASAHKFNGPPGIGVLLVRADVPLRPLLFGGVQQQGLRPGTEPVALAVGMRVALELAVRGLAAEAARQAALRERFETALRAAIPQLVVHAERARRVGQTSCIAFPGAERQRMMLALDTASVACSTGSACESGSSEPSPVLLAQGCPKHLLEASLRFSWGRSTTAAEVDEAARRIIAVFRGFSADSPGRKSSPAARDREGVSL